MSNGKKLQDQVLTIVDFAGTGVFAIEGALAAIHGRLDLLGLMVLAFVTALGGGIIRDLLIGATPPASIKDWRYPTTAFLAASATFIFYQIVKQFPNDLMMLLDAAGLSLFAIAGAEKALNYQINPLSAVLMGGITGVGGGTIRDVFLGQIPGVLRMDIYATAALAGATIMVISRRYGLSPGYAALLGGISCFVLRVVSVYFHWNLPRISTN